MRTQLVEHPIRTLAVLLVLAFGFFMLSASGQHGTYWQDGPAWLGSTGWILFLVTALTFLVSAGYAAVRRTRGRRTA
jgi:protein-S-isoprenylcysteine O-methyltransferase Ste14